MISATRAYDIQSTANLFDKRNLLQVINLDVHTAARRGLSNITVDCEPINELETLQAKQILRGLGYRVEELRDDEDRLHGLTVNW